MTLEKFSNFTILRDDTIFGGTKRIALETSLPHLHADHFIYVGTVFGWGAPALAAACHTLGKKCTLLISQSDYTPPWRATIETLGATLIWTPPTPIEILNQQAAQMDGHLLAPGFPFPEFAAALQTRAQALPINPTRVWVPVVSGTLLTVLEHAWPDAEFHGVCVAKHHGYKGSATLHHAPEKFHQPAKNPPPYPSCAFSDAKLWQFAENLAKEGDLIWNTNP